MIAILATVLAQAVSPPTEEDIVVLARRMRFIEVDIKAPKRDGKVVVEHCRVTKSSGNAELDAVTCQAAYSCAADTLATRKMLERCTEERAQPLLDAIVARWRAARVAQP